MTMLKMIDAPIDSLKPNPWNTNVVTPENEQKIEASLKRLEFFRPILARRLPDGMLEIIGGEHRWSVAKRMGHTSIPVIDLGSITDQKAKEIGLVDNGRYGEDDPLSLAELLKDLGDTSEILSFMPYSGDELEHLFSASSIDLTDLDIPEDDGTIPRLPEMKGTATHQIMRFKIPVEDSDFIQKLIELTMKTQNFTDDDSMTNAGNALVHLLKGIK